MEPGRGTPHEAPKDIMKSCRSCTGPANSTGRVGRSSTYRLSTLTVELACRVHVGRVGRSSASLVGYMSVELAGQVHRRSSTSRSSWPVNCIAVELAGRVQTRSSWPLSGGHLGHLGAIFWCRVFWKIFQSDSLYNQRDLLRHGEIPVGRVKCK